MLSPDERCLVELDRQQRTRAAAAGCWGQQRLEQQLLQALVDLHCGAGRVRTSIGDHLFGITAATMGSSCLHLVVLPGLWPALAEALMPHLLTAPDGLVQLRGIAGLRERQPRAGHGDVALVAWGGDGRLVFHHCGRLPSDTTGAGAQARTALHRADTLHRLEDLKRREELWSSEELHQASRALRAALARLPRVEGAGHQPPRPVPVPLGATKYAIAPPVVREPEPSPRGKVLLRAQQDLLDHAEAAGPRTAAAVCPGQQRLEHHLVRALGSHADLDPEPGHFLWVTHALAGAACLHLTVQEWRFPAVFNELIPYFCDGDTLNGTPGLRQRPGTDPQRVELVPLDGHGRLVFHLTARHVEEWKEWETESEECYYVYCHAGCPPAPCPRQELATTDRSLIHRLHQLPGVHPAEHQALLAAGDRAQWAETSRRLRQALARHPAPAPAHHHPIPLDLPRLPTAPPLPAPGQRGRERGPRELRPEAFTREPQARSTEDLAAALARQLLPMLETGAAEPGDVIYDAHALAQRIGGPRSTANGIQILRRVSTRYGLVRNRPVRTEDPPGPLIAGHTMTWEISPAAPALASLVAAELRNP
ncbi:hypothetical protein ACFY1P_20730 [Streptomyces sp. NPDC001407]|uniref:hypothetical protein n=1 Tax=Streptomyces sp. NPDC001407 TaxID=3364573 RepID=UPI0036B7320D